MWPDQDQDQPTEFTCEMNGTSKRVYLDSGPGRRAPKEKLGPEGANAMAFFASVCGPTSAVHSCSMASVAFSVADCLKLNKLPRASLWCNDLHPATEGRVRWSE
mmetsp:Transcript_80316/g.167270  ORF Transcript_80316/g.167270 Transcript_80316/m.167270 type:complete len:104 (+) Transcript_80316:61-372(+)